MRFHALIIRIARSKVKSGARLGVILLSLLSLSCWPVRGAFELNLAGSRAVGMGGAGVAAAGDSWAVVRNPALAAMSAPQVGISWSQQFGLPELTREAVTVTSNIRGQAWALRGTTFGSELYRESEFGLALARSVHPSLTLGIEASGRWLQIQEYSLGRAFALTAGMTARPMEQVILAAVWRNFNEPRIDRYRDRIAESLTIGAAIEVTDGGLLVADVVQEMSFPAEYRIGAEARVLSPLLLRVGMRAEPVRPSVGIELAARRWHFLYAVDLHPDLGASHELGLAFRFQQ